MFSFLLCSLDNLKTLRTTYPVGERFTQQGLIFFEELLDHFIGIIQLAASEDGVEHVEDLLMAPIHVEEFA